MTSFGRSKTFTLGMNNGSIILSRESDPNNQFILHRIKGSPDFLIEDPKTKKKMPLSKKKDFELWNEINNHLIANGFTS